MTLVEFYEQHAVDSRAVLFGSADEPRVWLTRLPGDKDMYCVCFHQCEGLLMREGTTKLSALAPYIEREKSFGNFYVVTRGRLAS